MAKNLTIVTGILTASGAIWMKASGAKVVKADEARAALGSFYDHVQDKEFVEAFDLIHSARKQEMNQQGRDYADFVRAYQGVREYRNVRIDFDRAESPTARFYWVSFDVKDSFPHSSLFDAAWNGTDKAVDSGVVNEEQLVKDVVADLRRSYTVPDSALPGVRQYLRNAKLHYVLEPSFVADVGDGLHLTRNDVNGADSWSHHIQHVRMEKENGWRIRSGLYPDSFAASYPPGADIPSSSK